MRTPSGILHVVDFKTEQIVANIQTKDYWDDKRHWEIKNNIDTLEFRVFDNTDHAATLMQQNLVLKEVRDGRIVPYVITEAEKDSNDRSVIAYASGEWIQLAKAGIIPPQKIEGKTVMEMMDIALSGTKWKKGNIAYASFRSMTIDEFIDPLSFLKKIASLFELEIQYRAEVVGSQIVGRYVDMVKKRGQETGKEVTLGKDLVGIKRVENSQNICTSLVGFVKKEGDTIITVESINNGLPYIVDSDAFQRWNERGHHKFGFYTPETEEDITPQRLMTLMKTELAKRVNTSVSYEVQSQSIGRIFGLAHELINEGDTIRIKDTGFTPKLYLEARAIAGDESFTDPSQDKYVFGDYREITDPNEELRKIYNRILSSLGNKQEMLDQLDKLVKEANETASNAKKESEVAKTLAEKVQKNIEDNTVEIIESNYPPTTGIKDRKTLWLDISNGKPGILKLWKDGIWDPVVPDVESVKKETLEQVSKDIETTKNELNEKVQSVEGKAQEIAGQIVDVQKQINNKVDQTWINTQLKDKADKSGVFTKDEINNGFIGKQIYETDKQGNVKKFQEISTSFEQTNEAIKSKAEKQSVTDLGNNLSQVSKVANEAKQTADGNTRTISQVDSKVNQTATDFTKKTTAIEETVTGVSTKVTNIQTEQGKISERVTKSEQTADGFKTSIESLTKKDNEIGNKLNSIEQDANGTRQKIERVESNMNNLEVGMNNLFIDTEFIDPWATWWAHISNIEGTEEHGDRVLKVTPVTNNQGGVYQPIGAKREGARKPLPLGWYTVSVWVQGVPGMGIGIIAEAAEGHLHTSIVLTREWKRYSLKFEVTNPNNNATICFYADNGNELNTFFIKKPQIQVGKVLGDYNKSVDNYTDSATFKKVTTEITQEAGRTKETMTQVKSRMDNLDIGANNLVIHSSCNNEWPLFLPQEHGGYDGGVEKQFYNEHIAMKCVRHTDAFYQLGNYEKTLRNLEPGKQVTISVDINCESTDYHFEMFYTTNAEGTNWDAIYGNPYKELNVWKRQHYTFTIPTNATAVFFRIYFGRYESSTGTYLNFKNVQIEKGNVATGYKRAYQDQVTVNEFTKKTTEIEKSVEGVKTTITNVQNSQAGFENRMTTVEQTASGLSSTVSNLNNVVSDQGKKITDANTKIEQQAQAIKAKVEIKQVEDYVGGFQIPKLKNTVTKNKEDLIEEISKKVATKDYNQKTTELERLISANAEGISFAAIKTEVYTKVQADGKYADKAYVEKQAARIDLTEKNILSTVQKGDIISAINQTAEKITIDVAKLNINADTVVKWLTTKGIDADVIKISGDKVTIDKNGVTVKMANFLYEDELGQKFSIMPKKNLIADHMFSSISCYLQQNNMRKVKYSPEWRITGEPYIENNYYDFGYEQMINAMRINIQHWIRYPLFSGVKKGKKYTLSAHFRAATLNGNITSDYPRLRVITGHFAPDGRPIEDLRFEKAFDAPGRNIVRYSNTFTIPNNFPDNGFCYFDIYGAGDYASNMAVCVSGVQLVEGELPSVYSWETTMDNLASGYTPVQSLAIGDNNTFLGYGVNTPEFRINTNADVHFNRKVSTYGVNVGGQAFGAYGSIFYVNGASGWSFYTMGIDGNWKTWNGI
ncbi:phage tail spike protein [Bacillus sp. TH19]|uniref:phage tail spike protein n=1 Tax=Bacillus sp. TH19 TaxID=2796385 RepID=UPI001F5B87B9|nr:phage tail spike protein [Bacillus sp. TH19]